MTVEVQVKLVMASVLPVTPPPQPLSFLLPHPSLGPKDFPLVAPQAGITSMHLPRGLELEQPDLCRAPVLTSTLTECTRHG